MNALGATTSDVKSGLVESTAEKTDGLKIVGYLPGDIFLRSSFLLQERSRSA
jgi:hypothetical protein